MIQTYLHTNKELYRAEGGGGILLVTKVDCLEYSGWYLIILSVKKFFHKTKLREIGMIFLNLFVFNI